MILTPEQAERFYRLWISLLDFVNRKHGINKKLYGMTSPKGLQIDTVRKIRDALWADLSLLDAYAEQNPYHLTARMTSKLSLGGKPLSAIHSWCCGI